MNVSDIDFDDKDAVKNVLEELLAEKDRLLRHKGELEADLKKYRDTKNDLQSQLEEFKSQLEDLQSRKAHGDDVVEKAEEIAAQKIEKMQAQWEEKLAELSQQAEEYKNQYSSLQSKYADEKVALAVRQAAEKAGVVPTAIDDVVLRAKMVFKLGEDGSIEARDQDGNLLKYGKKVLTPDVFMEQLQEQAPHFWPASQSAGTGGRASGSYKGKNPFKKEHWNFTEQVKLMNENPDLAERLKAEAEAA